MSTGSNATILDCEVPPRIEPPCLWCKARPMIKGTGFCCDEHSDKYLKRAFKNNMNGGTTGMFQRIFKTLGVE